MTRGGAEGREEHGGEGDDAQHAGEFGEEAGEVIEEFAVVVDEFVGGVEGGADGGGFEDVAGPVFDDVPAGLVGGVLGEVVADDVLEVLHLGHVVEVFGEIVGLAQDGAEFVVGVVERFAVGGWWGAVARSGDDRGVEGEFAGLTVVRASLDIPFVHH